MIDNSKTSSRLLFQKEIFKNICNICGLERKLIEDHVPPQSVTGKGAFRITHGLLDDYSPSLTTKSNNGIFFKTICSECNGRLSVGDQALKQLSENVKSFFESSHLVLPIKLTLKFKVSLILRIIFGHLLSVQTKAVHLGQSEFDNKVRECVKDFNNVFPSEIYVYFFGYRFHSVRVYRDFFYAELSKKPKLIRCQSMRFYPIGFLVSEKKLPLILPEIGQFGNSPLDEEIEISIDLNSTFVPEEFPEKYAFGNYVVIRGDTMQYKGESRS